MRQGPERENATADDGPRPDYLKLTRQGWRVSSDETSGWQLTVDTGRLHGVREVEASDCDLGVEVVGEGLRPRLGRFNPINDRLR